MDSLAVIETLNVTKDALPRLSPGEIVIVENKLPFQGAEKTFSRCIIPAVAFAAHAADCAIFSQKALKVFAGILRPSI